MIELLKKKLKLGAMALIQAVVPQMREANANNFAAVYILSFNQPQIGYKMEPTTRAPVLIRPHCV